MTQICWHEISQQLPAETGKPKKKKKKKTCQDSYSPVQVLCFMGYEEWVSIILTPLVDTYKSDHCVWTYPLNQGLTNRHNQQWMPNIVYHGTFILLASLFDKCKKMIL